MSEIRSRYVENLNPFINTWNQKQTKTQEHNRKNKYKLTKEQGNGFIKHKMAEFDIETMQKKLIFAQKKVEEEIQKLIFDEEVEYLAK